ncbi:MAG: ATP-grasp domain-containing protein [Proteobacteria bacterium]|nr:ATP-grasp domain-containing protein [Pseudomonadota bacterium]MDA1057715.1 ATP-grasp domain-containing protein [Pseudomonadota bacterium]
MPRLLLLVPTSSYRIGDFLKAAQATGAEVVVGVGKGAGTALPGDGAFSVDFSNHNVGVTQIADYAVLHPLDAIVAVDEGPTLLAARASQALGLAHNKPDSIEAAGNKRRLREVLSAAGLPQAQFEVLPIDGPARTRVAFPCVVKPLAMSASRGVIRADDQRAFEVAFSRTAAIVRSEDPNLRSPTSRALLVESFVPGVEVALEGLLVNGTLKTLAIFDKPDPLDGPYFEETIYVTPSRLDQEKQKVVQRAAAQAVAAVGLHSGPIHAEIRLDGTDAYVLEVAARSIGGLCGRALRFGTGLSLEEIIVRHALGQTVETNREDRAAGVMMIPIPAAGCLDYVDGLAEAQFTPGIHEVTISIPRGEIVVPLPEGNRYLGFILARGDTPDAVEDSLRAAHRCLRFGISAPQSAPPVGSTDPER